MLVDIKYREDDIVRFYHRQSVTTSCTCSFCGATGFVKGMDGTEEECPRCDGVGFETLSTCQDMINEGTIQKIGVNWKRGKDPEVFYIMSGWSWSTTEIPQDRIVEKIGEWVGPHKKVKVVAGDWEKKLP